VPPCTSLKILELMACPKNQSLHREKFPSVSLF